MDGMDAILSDLEGNVLCAKCGRPYGRSAMKDVGTRAGRHFVRCTCDKCRTEAVLIVIVKEVEGPSAPATPSFTKDDVLDAAELMSSPQVTLSQLGLA